MNFGPFPPQRTPSQDAFTAQHIYTPGNFQIKDFLLFFGTSIDFYSYMDVAQTRLQEERGEGGEEGGGKWDIEGGWGYFRRGNHSKKENGKTKRNT